MKYMLFIFMIISFSFGEIIDYRGNNCDYLTSKEDCANGVAVKKFTAKDFKRYVEETDADLLLEMRPGVPECVIIDDDREKTFLRITSEDYSRCEMLENIAKTELDLYVDYLIRDYGFEEEPNEDENITK